MTKTLSPRVCSGRDEPPRSDRKRSTYRFARIESTPYVFDLSASSVAKSSYDILFLKFSFRSVRVGCVVRRLLTYSFCRKFRVRSNLSLFDSNVRLFRVPPHARTQKLSFCLLLSLSLSLFLSLFSMCSFFFFYTKER